MADPITVEIPHGLGREGARARLAGGIGKLAGTLPGGTLDTHHWDGDILHFTLSAMGQTVASRLDVRDDRVIATVDLPPLLALFAGRIRDALAREGPKLLN